MKRHELREVFEGVKHALKISAVGLGFTGIAIAAILFVKHCA